MNTQAQKKRRLLPRVRNLYSWGYDRGDISRMTGVGTRTLYRWQHDERVAGLDWDMLRAETRRTNSVILAATLEARIIEAIFRQDLTPTQRADALCKLSLVLERERGRNA